VFKFIKPTTLPVSITVFYFPIDLSLCWSVLAVATCVWCSFVCHCVLIVVSMSMLRKHTWLFSLLQFGQSILVDLIGPLAPCLLAELWLVVTLSRKDWFCLGNTNVHITALSGWLCSLSPSFEFLHHTTVNKLVTSCHLINITHVLCGLSSTTLISYQSCLLIRTRISLHRSRLREWLRAQWQNRTQFSCWFRVILMLRENVILDASISHQLPTSYFPTCGFLMFHCPLYLPTPCCVLCSLPKINWTMDI